MKPKQEDPKEMVGGCCVCADENGWTENPLVYCDGQGCNVAVHQACYGIVTVPTGSWYCRKCESQERTTRVQFKNLSSIYHGDPHLHSSQSSSSTTLMRCELCPSKDGALKRTDSGGWAHVVCALYIPEVRFGNVTTMEPIMLQLIPPERFNKSCYICEENGKASRATVGACMQCNKAGCKQHFHVICAQAMGLLCEEAGNYLDNVKYCGYCQYHYSKLRKGSHVKTIPPYRPVAFDTISSEEEGNQSGQESRDFKLKKRLSKSSPLGDSSKLSNRDVKGSNSEGTSSKLIDNQDLVPPADAGNTTNSPTSVKSEIKTDQVQSDSSVPITSSSTNTILKHPSLSVKTTTSTSSTSLTTSSYNTPVTLLPSTIGSCLVSSISSSIALSSGLTASALNSGPCSSILQSVPLLSSQNNNSAISTTVHSSPFTPSSIVTTISSTAAASRVKTSESSSTLPQSNQLPTSDSSSDKDKMSKIRRSGTRTTSGESDPLQLNEDSHSKEFSLIINEEKNLSAEAKDKSGGKIQNSPEGLNVQYTPNVSAQTGRVDTFNALQSDFAAGETSKRSRSQERGRRSKRGGGYSKRGRTSSTSKETLPPSKEGRESGASSPESFTSESAPAAKRGRTKKIEPPPPLQPPKEPSPASVVANGLGAATLLLGNQINPASAVAQKMTDTLHAELEAHSIYKDEEKINLGLIGPSLPGKRESSTPGGTVGSSQPPPLPQSLEQLLERQWEQGSQFLMEQAQHFDIASLLSCLHQLRQENARLEETVSTLSARRDHLLAVNARLSVPLTSTAGASQSPSSASSSSSIASSAALFPPLPTTSISATAAGISSSATITHSAIGGHPPHPPHHPGAPITAQHSLGPGGPGGGLASRPHSQGRHPSGRVFEGGASHPSSGSSNPISGRGTSPHDRRAIPGQISLPLENGLGEPEYRYRPQNAGDHQHRQQSPMLHPGMQANPAPMRQSPASGNYHSSSSPHTGVPSLSPSGASHAPPPPPPHTLVSHASHVGLSHAPTLVSTSHVSSHSVPHSRAPPDHSRAELVRLSSGQPPHSNPSVGYPVYQMVSPPVPGPHHSPVGLAQHPQPHTQVLRREVVESGRVGGPSLDKR